MGKSLWPLFLLIASNLVYQTCAKCASKEANPFIILMTAYIISAVGAALLFLLSGGLSEGIMTNVRSLNWANYLLGLAIIGLEGGFIWLYRSGWSVSIGPICSYTGVALGLLFLGALCFKEQITYRQILGTLMCLGGIALISFKR